MKYYDLYGGDVELRFDEEDHKYEATVEGEDIGVVPSVTGITKILTPSQALLGWYYKLVMNTVKNEMKIGHEYDEIERDKFARYVANSRYRSGDQALDVGSLVHNKIEKYIEFQIEYGNCEIVPSGEDLDEDPYITMPINDEAKRSIKQFISWMEDKDIVWKATERKVMSKELGVAGTLDAMATIDGKNTLIDWKTSKSIYFSYYVQASAYLNFVREEFEDRQIDQIMIIRVPKYGKEFETGLLKDPELIDMYWECFKSCRTIYDIRQQHNDL